VRERAAAELKVMEKRSRPAGSGFGFGDERRQDLGPREAGQGKGSVPLKPLAALAHECRSLRRCQVIQGIIREIQLVEQGATLHQAKVRKSGRDHHYWRRPSIDKANTIAERASKCRLSRYSSDLKGGRGVLAEPAPAGKGPCVVRKRTNTLQSYGERKLVGKQVLIIARDLPR
jgi:hypothetical protein